MIVDDLKKELEQYDGNLQVYDGAGYEIEKVSQQTWEDTNYPYNKPDKKILVIS